MRSLTQRLSSNVFTRPRPIALIQLNQRKIASGFVHSAIDQLFSDLTFDCCVDLFHAQHGEAGNPQERLIECYERDLVFQERIAIALEKIAERSVAARD